MPAATYGRIRKFQVRVLREPSLSREEVMSSSVVHETDQLNVVSAVNSYKKQSIVVCNHDEHMEFPKTLSFVTIY